MRRMYCRSRCMKAFTHLPTFEGARVFPPGLPASPSNSALMLLRKRRAVEISIDAHGIEGEAWSGWELADTGGHPRRHTRSGRRSSIFRSAIRSLRPPSNKVAHLRRTEDYSASEIAAALGISILQPQSRGCCAARWRSALQCFERLRREIGPCLGRSLSPTTIRLRPNARSRRYPARQEPQCGIARGHRMAACRRIRRLPAPMIRHCPRRSRTIISGSTSSCRRKAARRWRRGKGCILSHVV